MTQLQIRNPGELLTTLIILACASVSPLIFVAASGGYGSMHFLAIWGLLPALAVWIMIGVVAPFMGWDRLARGINTGVLAGIAGTVALEIVRIIGFRVFSAMPGSMPKLIGVLITNRFMLGPDTLSNVLGWADHFLNGISFATIFVLVFGRTRAWAAIPYALGIATIFMLSPATTSTGIGYFGVDFGPSFAVTVYLAHIAFALAFGNVIAHSAALQGSIWRHHLLLGETTKAKA